MIVACKPIANNPPSDLSVKAPIFTEVNVPRDKGEPILCIRKFGDFSLVWEHPIFSGASILIDKDPDYVAAEVEKLMSAERLAISSNDYERIPILESGVPITAYDVFKSGLHVTAGRFGYHGAVSYWRVGTTVGVRLGFDLPGLSRLSKMVRKQYELSDPASYTLSDWLYKGYRWSRFSAWCGIPEDVDTEIAASIIVIASQSRAGDIYIPDDGPIILHPIVENDDHDIMISVGEIGGLMVIPVERGTRVAIAEKGTIDLNELQALQAQMRPWNGGYVSRQYMAYGYNIGQIENTLVVHPPTYSRSVVAINADAVDALWKAAAAAALFGE